MTAGEYIYIKIYYISLINSPHEVGNLGMVQMASGLYIYISFSLTNMLIKIAVKDQKKNHRVGHDGEVF